MKLELREFITSVKNMHTHSGVKRTRLMLKMRPFHTRKTFVLKATDGKTTLTTRVAHQGQLRMVENMINEFVETCTAASLQAAEAAAVPASSSASHTAGSTAATKNTATTAASSKKGGNNNSTNNKGGKKKGKK